MNIRRKLLVALGAGALAAPLLSLAQQKGKVWRIGFLGAASASASARWVEALRAGLRELGYVEGRNFAVEFRWAEGKYERLPDLAAELASLKVDVIVTHGTPGTLAAKRTTATIPIVMAVSGDPVGTGLVVSLARPGGNITGSTFFDAEISAKRVELLKEALPRTKRVAALLNSNNPVLAPMLEAMKETARSLKVELQPFGVRSPDEFEGAFAAMAKQRVDGVAIQQEVTFSANAKSLAVLAAKQGLPSIGFIELADAGGLMAYGVHFPALFHRTAAFIDKILKGAKPGDLPIERATKFELVINMNTARALGITIPQSILVRADRVIE